VSVGCFSTLPSLQYPSSSSCSGPSSRLSSYHTHSPALHYSPVRRGDSIYYPATPVRSPTPLEEPIDWEPIYHHGATTDSTIVPPLQVLGRMSILSTTLYVEYTYHQKSLTLFEREYSWGVQQRAEEQRCQQIWERIFEIRTRIEERLNREARAPPGHPPFPNLVPCRWFRGAPPHPFLRNCITPLQPRESLRLPTCYHEDYARH
jgi:hypothetical protein